DSGFGGSCAAQAAEWQLGSESSGCSRAPTSASPGTNASRSDNRPDMPMAQIKFGTDGWRAVIAEDFTFNNVERVAQAAADYWNRNAAPGTGKRVIIGYDRRFLSDQFALRAGEVFSGNGFEVTLTDRPIPTPAVS